MKMLKSVLAAVLCLCTALSLAACGEDKNAAVHGWTGLGGCYKAEIIETAMKQINQIAVHDNEIYISGWDGKSKIVTSRGEIFYTSETDGGISRICTGEDGIWVLELLLRVEDGGMTTDSRLRLLSYTGEVLTEVVVSSSQEDSFVDLAAGDGRAFVLWNKEIQVYDLAGDFVGKTGFDESVVPRGLVRGASGEVYVARFRSGQPNSELCPVSPEGVLDDKAAAIFDDGASDGIGEHEYFTIAENGVYAGTKNGADQEPVLLWDECGISLGSIFYLCPMGDGFVCMDSNALWRISPADPSEMSQKTVVTLGAVSQTNNMREYVTDFNNQSDKYFVRFQTYNAENDNSAAAHTAALTRLNAELATGGGPDVLLLTGVNTKAYAQKGVLLDLYDYMKRDGLDPQNYYALSALETDGKLTALASHFYINSLYGLEETLGKSIGWSYGDFFEFSEGLSGGEALLDSLSRERYLEIELSRYVLSRINWKTAKYSPESGTIDSIFAVADCLPDADDEVWYNESMQSFVSGATKLKSCMLAQVGDLEKLEEEVGKPLTFIGWPTQDGSVGESVGFSNRVGINANGKNADGAWEFIKFMLAAEGGGITLGMPLDKAKVDLQIFDLRNPDAEFEGKELVVNDDGTFEVDGVHYDRIYDPTGAGAMTQEQERKLREILAAATQERSEDSDTSVFDIVSDEVHRYCLGNQTKTEVCDSLKSRVELYLSEQK